MRRLLTTFIWSFLFVGLVGGSVFQAKIEEKQEEKKEEKKDNDKGQKPIVIIIWEKAWPIVIRESQQQNTPDLFELQRDNVL